MSQRSKQEKKPQVTQPQSSGAEILRENSVGQADDNSLLQLLAPQYKEEELQREREARSDPALLAKAREVLQAPERRKDNWLDLGSLPTDRDGLTQFTRDLAGESAWKVKFEDTVIDFASVQDYDPKTIEHVKNTLGKSTAAIFEASYSQKWMSAAKNIIQKKLDENAAEGFRLGGMPDWVGELTIRKDGTLEFNFTYEGDVIMLRNGQKLNNTTLTNPVKFSFVRTPDGVFTPTAFEISKEDQDLLHITPGIPVPEQEEYEDRSRDESLQQPRQSARPSQKTPLQRFVARGAGVIRFVFTEVPVLNRIPRPFIAVYNFVQNLRKPKQPQTNTPTIEF